MHHDEFAPQDTRRLARRSVPVRNRNIDPRTAPRLHPFEPELSAEKTMNAVTTDEYDAFASDYHWLYSDRVLSGAPFVDSHATALRSLPPRARILDCACGIGIHSLALARHGYDVRGTDASAGMIAEARRRAALEGLEVEFAKCAWTDLPKKFTERFDLVFCYGNAIGHCRTPEETVASLCGMRAVLKPGGVLAIDSRNWEKLRRERVRFYPMPMRVRDGSRCLHLYAWNFPPRWQDPHLIEVVLLFQEEARTHHRSYPITYYPFHYQDLVIRLRGAGFQEVQSDFDDAKDTYTVIARTDNKSGEKGCQVPLYSPETGPEKGT